MKTHMKKVSILIGTTLILMGLCACENSKNVEITELETEEVVVQTMESEALTEEITSEEETTTEEARIPVDERYEYILYAEEDITPEKEENGEVQPIIGVNIPDGWAENGGEQCGSGHSGKYYQISLRMQPEDGSRAAMEITTNEFEYENYFVTGDIYGCKQMEFEEKETVETPFGTAQIYYCKLAVDISDWDFQDSWMEERFQSMLKDGTGFEEEGIRYTTEEQEVALITIGSNHILIKAPIAGNTGYQGVLKEDLAQIFKLD